MRKRPWALTCVAILLTLMALINLTRSIQAIVLWPLLEDLLPIWPGYLLLAGLGWFLATAAAAWGVLRGLGWARRWAPVVILGYSVFYWIERTVLPGDPERNANAAFAAGLNIILIAGCLWALHRPAGVKYLQEGHERQPENQSSA